MDKQTYKRILELSGQLNEMSNEEIRAFDVNDDPEFIDDKELLEVFELFYELEYKYNTLASPHYEFSGNPARKENILKFYESKGKEVNKLLAESFKIVFEDWLSQHALLSARTWAESRIKEIIEMGDDANSVLISIVSEYKRYKDGLGNIDPRDKRSLDGIFLEMLTLAFEALDKYPYLKRMVEDVAIPGEKERYYNDLSDMGLEEFNDMLGKEFKTQDEAESWIEEIDIDTIDIGDMFFFESIEQFASFIKSYGNWEEIAIEFSQNLTFPVWADHWKGMGIEGTRGMVEDNLQKLKELESHPINKQFSIINLSTQAVHQTGDMMDYYEQRFNVSKNNLDALSEQSGEKWKEELQKMGVIFPAIKEDTRILELAGVSQYEIRYEPWSLSDDKSTYTCGGKTKSLYNYTKRYPSWILYENNRPIAGVSNNAKYNKFVIVRYIESRKKGAATKLIEKLLGNGIIIETGKADYNSISPSAYHLFNKINKLPNIKATPIGKANNEGFEYSELEDKDVQHYRWEKL